MKMKKVLSIILAVATAISVTACSGDNTSSAGGNVSGNNSTVENTGNKVDDTLPQCEPANLPDAYNFVRQSVMKGKDGYYYTTYTGIGENQATKAIYYYDNATGKSIPLCSKPQCTHDGNDFCVATGGGAYHIYDSLAALYNGYIYRLGNNSEETDKWTLSLLKADLQGNEMSRVADICTAPLTDETMFTPEIRSAVFHYGKLFVSVSTLQKKWKTVLYVVDLASGEVKEIKLSTPEKGTTEWGMATCSYMTADGDWLYYTIRNCKFDNSKVQSENHMTYNRTVMHRYNIKTGETQTISALPDIYSSFSVADGVVYYTVADRRENTFSLYSYDIVADKTTTFADKIQRKYVSGKYVEDNNKITVVTDKKYVYVCTSGLEGHCRKEHSNPNQDDIDFYIYSLDGKELLHGMPGIDMTLDNYSYGFSAIDGEMYLAFQDFRSIDENLTGLYRIKTENLVNGSTDWQKLYTRMG